MKKKITTPPDPLTAPGASAAPPRRRSAKPKQQIAADKPAAQSVVPVENGGGPSHAEIAEAAYFRHLNRSGRSGDEFNDWLEAERELRSRRSR